MAVVVELPGRDGPDGIRQAHKPARVQTLVSELPVEALDASVLHGFAGLDGPQLDAAAIGPLVEHAARELGTAVEDESAAILAPCATRRTRSHSRSTTRRVLRVQGGAERAAPVRAYGQRPRAPRFLGAWRAGRSWRVAWATDAANAGR